MSLGAKARQLRQWQCALAGPVKRSRRQLVLDVRSGGLIQSFGLIQQEQPGLAEHRLLTVRQCVTGGQRLRVEHQQGCLHRQHPGPRGCAQLVKQHQRMAQAGRLNKQPVRFSVAQQARKADLKGHAVDAA